jgi:hypothetical protein
MNTLGATNSWPLADDGSTAYTGAVPSVTPAVCAMVDATVGTTSPSATCAAPSSAGACAAPSGTTTLATLANRTIPIALRPTIAVPVTLTVTIARDSVLTGLLYPNATGLHLTMSAAVVVTVATFTATLQWRSQDIEL